MEVISSGISSSTGADTRSCEGFPRTEMQGTTLSKVLRFLHAFLSCLVQRRNVWLLLRNGILSQVDDFVRAKNCSKCGSTKETRDYTKRQMFE